HEHDRKRASRRPGGAPGAVGEDDGRDAEQRPRLVVELENRVHAVQLLAVRVLQVDDLASPDHPEREKTEKGGEHDLALRAARERSPGGPSGEKRQEKDESERRRLFRERDSEGDDGRGREKEVAPAPPLLGVFANGKKKSRRRDGEEDPPDAQELEDAGRRVGFSDSVVRQL